MRERFEYKSSPSSLQAGAARDIHGNALPSNAFAGGNAKMIEKRFGVSGAQVPMAATEGCRTSHTSRSPRPVSYTHLTLPTTPYV